MTSTAARVRATPLLLGHAAAIALVAAAGLALLIRPLAPDLGPTPDAVTFFDSSFLARAEAYRAPLRVASVIALLLRIGVPLLIVWTPAGRRFVDALGRLAGDRHPLVAAAAVALGIVVVIDLVLLPLAFWAGYLHEGVWGFRTQGLAGWARDWFVARAPMWAGVAVLAAAGVWLVGRFPQGWAPIAGLAGGALVAVLVYVSPLVLEPLWFRMTPLEPGPVREEVEAVLARAGEPVDAILVADASRRTTKENAYVSGLGGTRRVVLYDTLLDRRSTREVGAVLAHELGHDRNGDLWRATLLGGAGAVIGAYAVAALLARIQAVEGPAAPGPRAVAAALVLLLLLSTVSLPLQTWASRRAERAADWASLEFTEDPESYEGLFRGFAESNLGDPSPPGWAYLLWWTHPTSPERLWMGESWAPGYGGTAEARR